jgi:Protein of unknown function (DUF2934)
MELIPTIVDTLEISTEDRIRAVAHQLWVDEGQPEGCADDHWHRACEMIAAQDQPPINHVEPEWLQRNPETPELAEELVSEKSELSKSIDEIKKRMIGRAA